MAPRYPWSHLGIAPTDDQKAIRKAYAAKLRQTRPDEDPAGFQALLEARDLALEESRYVSREHPDAHEGAADAQTVVSADDVLTVEPQAATPPEEYREAIQPLVAFDMPSVETMNPAQLTVMAEPDDHEEQDGSEVERLLAAVGKPHPWHSLKSQWAAVFDAMEASAFEDYFGLMYVVINRLVDDLRKRVGTIPDVGSGDYGSINGENRLLGPYGEVLRDLDARFQFLKQDTVLLEYLDTDEAQDLVNALTMAVGRSPVAQPDTLRPTVNVRAVEPAYIHAAFASEPKMCDYYTACLKDDKFHWSFSIWALLFPVPMALYYRLHGLAAFMAAALAMNFAIGLHAAATDAAGASATSTYVNMASVAYFVISVAFASQWRRLRIQAAIKQVERLMQGPDDISVIQGKLGVWGTPSRMGLLIGVLFLVALSAFQIYRHDSPRRDHRPQSQLSAFYCSPAGLRTPCQLAGQPRFAMVERP